MRKILLDKAVALGGPAPYNLISADDAFDWSVGTKGPRIGTNYTILRLCDMEKQRVFVPDAVPAISAEAVQQSATEMQFVKVDFDGLTATVSADKSGNLRIYAEAKVVRIVQPQTAPRKEG